MNMPSDEDMLHAAKTLRTLAMSLEEYFNEMPWWKRHFYNGRPPELREIADRLEYSAHKK